MRFISASALWWLLLSVLVILFYLLKVKRAKRLVPSVILWQRALLEVEANTPFRKLRRSLLLILQLLALIALVLALARPLVATRALTSSSSVIVVDTTASMSSLDGTGVSRLARAKQVVHDLITKLPAGSNSAIIESSSRAKLLTALTADKTVLHKAVDQIEPTDTAGQLSDALRLAEQIAGTERDKSVVVVSDGCGAGLDKDARPSTRDRANTRAALRYIRVGSASENIGIVAMNTRPALEAGHQELFASVANFGEQDRTFDVELRLDDRLIDVRAITVSSKSRNPLIFDIQPTSGVMAELKLLIADDLAADNIAYCYIPDSRRIKVGVATSNPFLLGALSVNPEIDARRIEGADTAGISSVDCLVVEGDASPAISSSDRPLLIINPRDMAGLCRAIGQIERPELGAIDHAHPVNGFLTYPDLHVQSASRLETPSWLKPIVFTANKEGIIWAGADQRRRVVIVGFDLAASDLTVKVDFPIFIANATSWLAGRDQAATLKSIRAGQPAIVQPGDTQATGKATIKSPTGVSSVISANNDGTMVYADTLNVGRYEVTGGAAFAASLLSDSESDTAPRDSIETSEGTVTGQAELFSAEREVWWWLGLSGLLLLSLEWWAYHRRIA